MKRFNITLLIIVVLFVLTVFLFLFINNIFAASYPQPTGFVNDFAHVYSQTFLKTQEQKLSEFQKATTDEIAVVTVDTTGNTSIEEYTIGLADQWKPGVKGKDNGIVLVFAIKDHKDRIEVGRGLQGDLTDIQASNILDDIKSDLRSGNYDKATDKATDEIIKAITNPHPVVANEAGQSATTKSNQQSGAGFIIFVIATIIIGLITFAFIRSRRNDEDDDDFPDTTYPEDDEEETPITSKIDPFAAGFAVGTFTGYKAYKYPKPKYTPPIMTPVEDSTWGVPVPIPYTSSSSSSSSDDDDDSSSSWGGGSSFGGFSGGSFNGGGASGSW